MIEELCDRFGIKGRVREAALKAYARVAELRYDAQRTARLNVLHAFTESGISESDLHGSLGYGYDDAARVAYEGLLARILGAERVLARLSIVSGTHAIILALAACSGPGRTILSITGRPYDTLRNSICEAPNALVNEGIDYREVALREDGTFDAPAIGQALQTGDVAVAFVQRSRGYAPRPSVDVAACERIYAEIKALSPRTVVLVDNCYGELVEDREPALAGADLIAGSLIKNLGGSIAPSGGYVAGRAELIETIAARHYAPGLGAALGPTLGFGRALIQGLFLAPLVVEQALRGLDFTAALFAELGFWVDPEAGARRTDIVQAIRLGAAGRVTEFARAFQRAMPVNARFRPEPGSVPGYREPVIMSSGAFIAGSTIELSCDAPMREPYDVYVQGGVLAEHGYTGALLAAAAVA
jgi:cystathionine beta-lyase family protein involved in aluminum resistance